MWFYKGAAYLLPPTNCGWFAHCMWLLSGIAAGCKLLDIGTIEDWYPLALIAIALLAGIDHKLGKKG